MSWSFNLTFNVSDAVPEAWAYWRPATPMLPMANSNAESMLLRERCADVRVVFTELDNGCEVEWRVELAPSFLTKAQHFSLVHHGYMPLAQFRQAISAIAVAGQLALMSLNQVYPFKDETVVFH